MAGLPDDTMMVRMSGSYAAEVKRIELFERRDAPAAPNHAPVPAVAVSLSYAWGFIRALLDCAFCLGIVSQLHL